MSVRRVGVSRSLRPWGRVHGGDLLTQQLADGPLAAWPMQETSGTAMLDASGNGRHGTYTDVVLAQSPLIHGAGYSVAFYGNGVATVADDDWLDVEALTVEVVMISTSGRRWPYQSSSRMSVVQNTAEGLRMLAPSVDVSTANSALTYGTIAVIAATYEFPGSARLYINGTQVASAATAGALTPQSNALAFGLQNSSGVARLSHAAFYDRALSADDILRHAQVAGLA